MVIEQKFKPGEEPDPTEFLYISMEQKLQDQALPYDGKKDCWVPDPEEGFSRGEITGTSGDNITVRLSNGQEQSFKKDLVGQVNPPKYEKSEDMSNLTYLNDASVLHNLKTRYQARLIYTYSGLFCIAINPYKRYPIYSPRAMKIYQGKRRNEVPPHIFAIADGAYTEMKQNKENQSILITGESGAGKTENTKKVIAYFANIGASGKGGDDKKKSLEDQIVQTNPVLEAYGNAKTTRNDNSSRFGKFIRIHFSPNGKLAGADIETYLLEKARVVSQQPAERGYHIFYQMMSGKVKGMKDMLFLSDDIYDYHFASQGKTTIPGIDDGEELEATHEAFEILGFSNLERENVYKVTASVMHMGEMKFKQKGREEQAEADGMAEGERVAKLLGVQAEDLYKNFTKPKIKVGTEFVTKGQNKDQCLYSVSAMAKAIFDRVFLYLVKKCNDTLDTKQHRASFIGVLDIAGFEIFDYNGFEQICINFTNEKLQQFFNHHMFVLEQEEYKKEGLDWIFEDFGMDLAACIELMEKPMGIFAILEEQSMFPKATDQSFSDMLKANHLGKSPVFIKPKPPKPGCVEAHFSCVHYAGTVPYNITGWLEKNKDPVNDTVVDQFKKGTNELVHIIFANHPGQTGAAADAGGGGGKKKKGMSTVSSSFREQLNSLMTTLKSTHPNFIRCIVPNESKTPGKVEAALIMHQLTCNGVLEGIRICRKGFPNRMIYDDFKHRYILLAPTEMKAEKEDKAIATACFNKIGLDADKYRVGHTKVFFRAGVLGELEEIRDDKLAKLVTWLQAAIRGYNGMKQCQRLKDQRVALLVCQRAIKAYNELLTWPWKDLMEKIKPLLGDSKAGEEIRQLEEKAAEAQAAWEKEEKLRKDIEEKNARILAEKNELQARYEQDSAAMGDFQEKIAKATSDKQQYESKLNELNQKLQREEESVAKLHSDKKKLDQEMVGVKKELEDLELMMHKSDSSKSTKEHQIRSLNDEIARQDEAINKLNKEKKQIAEQNQKAIEELQGTEDRVNHLAKVKAKLEQTLDDLEDALEREKKQRNETEKQKRKVEGDVRLMTEAIADLERDKKELENALMRKDKEITAASQKLDDEQAHIAKLQRGIKEFQGRIEEREEELESERQGRAKAEKQSNEMFRELEDLKDRLDEAGGATSAQIELNKKREAELAKLRRDVEEGKIQHDSAMASIRNKNADAVAEMSEQIETLNKIKAKAERDRAGMAAEVNDIRHAIDHLTNEKLGHEKVNKNVASQINELQSRVEETSRNLSDYSAAKSRLATENMDISRQLEDALQQINQLSKYKLSLTSQLDEVKRQAEEESRGRAGLVNKYRMVEHRVDTLKEQLNEEESAKQDLLRQLQRAQADANVWKGKFAAEGMGKAEELEESKRKLQCRLNEAESVIEAINQKVLSMEKGKQIIAAELDDLRIEAERVRAISSSMNKKEKAFENVVREWKQKVDSLTSELDQSQKDCRNYSTEHFRYKSAFDEVSEQLEGVRRENKSLGDEIKDLMDQIGDGGRGIHELDKARRRLEQEKEELQAALEEAEQAVEQEENKVLKAQVELSQIQGDIQRRIRDKEEEFENTRKNHQRAIDSLQLSLEAEAKQKAEVLRLKKKLESDIHELESALEGASKTNQEAQKSIKRHYQQLKDTQAQVEDEVRNRDDAREACIQMERRANGLAHDLEESRSLLEIADRGRRAAEQETANMMDSLNDISAQVSSAATAKRKLESELKTLQADLEEILTECRGSEEKAKKAMVDAARLADELRLEQDNSRGHERMRKQLELQAKDLQTRLDELETAAHKGGKKAAAKLEERVKQLEAENENEVKANAETQKAIRKTERLVKELGFKADEDRKNLDKMNDNVEKLNHKVRTLKAQIEEAEEIAAMNLAKFRKTQQDYEETAERAEQAEQQLSRLKSKGRAGSVH